MDLKQKYEFTRIIKKNPKKSKQPYNTKLGTVEEVEDLNTSVTDVVEPQLIEKEDTTPVTQPKVTTIVPEVATLEHKEPLPAL